MSESQWSAVSSLTTKANYLPTGEEAILSASGVTTYFGSSVAVNENGNYAIIGDPNDNTQKGAAYIFIRSGTTWTQQAKLTASDGLSYEHFGASVAISSDGSYVIIGSPDAESVGTAYIFKRINSTWAQEVELKANNAQHGPNFGCSVSISDDGSRVIVGNYEHIGQTGKAYIFSRTGTSWTQEAVLIAIDGTNGDFFGYSVSISNDGMYSIIGAYRNNSGNGAAYIFMRSGTTWNQQAKLVANDAYFNSYFGNSVDISGDGSICVVTSYNKNNSTGQAYIFIRSGTNWSQSQGLIAGDGSTNDNFGYSCSISTNGSRIIIGSRYGDKPSVADCGSVYIFDKFGPIWTQQAEVNPSNGISNGSFGCSISISGDGNLIVAGTLNSKAYIFA